MGNNPLSYNPPAPLPGRYVATIMTTYRDDRGIYIIYDIVTGEHAGWATVTYINTGSYLLQQRHRPWPPGAGVPVPCCWC